MRAQHGATDEAAAGATVYAIPAGLVARPRVTAADVVAATAADLDEPLQGLIDAMGASFPSAVTDDEGAHTLSPPADRYSLYVVPDPGDPLHLPGGSSSRRALAADARPGQFIVEPATSRRSA